MGDRRKRRSFWDKEAEAKHFSGQYHSNHYSGQYHDYSASEPYRAPNSRDNPGQQSSESIEENTVALMNGSFTKSRENAPEGKETGGEDRYFQKMSPGYKHSGNGRSHSHRYAGRGRSRSPSRTRGGSRSRSRSRSRRRSLSLSLSRGRERERARGRSRSRSRKRDRDRDDGIAGGGHRTWRNRADDGRISGHSYSNRGPRMESWDDVSDQYHGEDEQSQDKSRGATPCKDFMKGKCRWGDTCRFSHHFASDEIGKGTRYSSYDKDSEQQPYKNGKPPCKYFAAGKCDRNSCRFSHDDSRFNSLEGRQPKVTDDGSMENENMNWGIRERTDNLIDRDSQPSRPSGNHNYGVDLSAAESIGKENMAKNRELLMLHSSQLHNQDRDLNVQISNRFEVDQRFSMEPWQNVSQVPHIQQQVHGLVENNPSSSFRSNVLDELKDSRIASDPIILPGQKLPGKDENVFPGHSSIPNKGDSGQNMPYPNPSSLIINLNLQSQMQNHQNAIPMTEVSETSVPRFFPNMVTSEHFAQLANSVVSLTGQPGALVEAATMQSNPVSVSHDPINPVENERGTNENGEQREQGNQVQVGQLSLPSIAGMGHNYLEPDDLGKPNANQGTEVAISELNEGERAIVEESQEAKDNMHSETLDGHGKTEESNANKDDKGMRLFKNSLVELVKDILKPTWKQGRMSREVHKTIVKKVVDKVTSTILANHIPKTQDKVEQYLSVSKPKIAKLVQAYVGRCLKTDS